MMENASKNALITGSGRGIGHAVAIKLAQRGYNIGITYRSSEAGARKLYEEILSMGRDAVLIQADMASMTSVYAMFDRFFEKFGHIDLLVNNAGTTRSGSLLTSGEDIFDQVVATDFKAPYFSIQRAAKNMIENQIHGVIVNITSNQAEGCFTGFSVYGSTKAALAKLTKHAAMELAPYGIRVVAVAPGYTYSDQWGDQNEPQHQKVKSLIPLGRYSDPEEMANIVAFVASEEAGYITGTTLTADGGALLTMHVDKASRGE